MRQIVTISIPLALVICQWQLVGFDISAYFMWGVLFGVWASFEMKAKQLVDPKERWLVKVLIMLAWPVAWPTYVLKY